jgi:HK97 family phage major capsid protein
MSKLQEKQTELIKLRGEWATLFKSKPDRDFDESELTTLQNKNDVMATLAKEVETLETLEKAAGENEREHEWLTKGVGVLHPNGEHKSGTQSEAKSVRELVEGDASFKRLAENRGAGTAQIELPSAMFKTLLALTDMYPNAQTTAFRPMAVETRTVRDLFAEGNTTSNVIQYWEETSLVNNAAAVAEGGTKPESALDFTLRSNIVEKIATWLPVTREMLSDVPQIRSLIENRLRYMVAMEVDDQLINGNGTTPNISGILDRSGVQTTAAASAAAAIDAIMTAITLIRVNALAEPDGIIMHPNDFSAIATLRTADGIPARQPAGRSKLPALGSADSRYHHPHGEHGDRRRVPHDGADLRAGRCHRHRLQRALDLLYREQGGDPRGDAACARRLSAGGVLHRHRTLGG